MKVEIMIFVFAFCAIVAFFSLLAAHKDKTKQFDLFDLLMENGRVSKIACAFMLVLAVSTWVIINLTVSGRLTEGYLTIYTGAWIVPLVTKVVANKNTAAEPDKA